MKTKNKKSIYRRLLFIGISVYVICIFINQQKRINLYKKTAKYYETEIEEKTEYQKELLETKSNINSKEYIEKVARENLDLYLPNERVYVAKGK